MEAGPRHTLWHGVLCVKGAYVCQAQISSFYKIDKPQKLGKCMNLKGQVKVTTITSFLGLIPTSGLMNAGEIFSNTWYFNVCSLKPMESKEKFAKIQNYLEGADSIAVVRIKEEILLIMSDSQLSEHLGLMKTDQSLHCLILSKTSRISKDKSPSQEPQIQKYLGRPIIETPPTSNLMLDKLQEAFKHCRAQSSIDGMSVKVEPDRSRHASKDCVKSVKKICNEEKRASQIGIQHPERKRHKSDHSAVETLCRDENSVNNPLSPTSDKTRRRHKSVLIQKSSPKISIKSKDKSGLHQNMACKTSPHSTGLQKGGPVSCHPVGSVSESDKEVTKTNKRFCEGDFSDSNCPKKARGVTDIPIEDIRRKKKTKKSKVSTMSVLEKKQLESEKVLSQLHLSQNQKNVKSLGRIPKKKSEIVEDGRMSHKDKTKNRDKQKEEKHNKESDGKVCIEKEKIHVKGQEDRITYKETQSGLPEIDNELERCGEICSGRQYKVLKHEAGKRNVSYDDNMLNVGNAHNKLLNETELFSERDGREDLFMLENRNKHDDLSDILREHRQTCSKMKLHEPVTMKGCPIAQGLKTEIPGDIELLRKIEKEKSRVKVSRRTEKVGDMLLVMVKKVDVEARSAALCFTDFITESLHSLSKNKVNSRYEPCQMCVAVSSVLHTSNDIWDERRKITVDKLGLLHFKVNVKCYNNHEGDKCAADNLQCLARDKLIENVKNLSAETGGEVKEKVKNLSAETQGELKYKVNDLSTEMHGVETNAVLSKTKEGESEIVDTHKSLPIKSPAHITVEKKTPATNDANKSINDVSGNMNESSGTLCELNKDKTEYDKVKKESETSENLSRLSKDVADGKDADFTTQKSDVNDGNVTYSKEHTMETEIKKGNHDKEPTIQISESIKESRSQPPEKTKFVKGPDSCKKSSPDSKEANQERVSNSLQADQAEPRKAATELKTVTPTVAKTVTSNVARTVTPTALKTVTPTEAKTVTTTVAKTVTSTVAKTVTSTVAKTVTSTVAKTVTSTVAKTVMPIVAKTVTSTASKIVTSTASKTVTPTASKSVISPASKTGMPTVAKTVMSTASKIVTPTVTKTVMPTVAKTVTSTASKTVMPTASKSAMPTPSETVMPTPSKTVKPTPSKTVMTTLSKTAMPTPSKSAMPTPSKPVITTPSKSVMTTPSKTAMTTPSKTVKPIPSKTVMTTLSKTAMPTPSKSAMPTPSKTVKPTPSKAAMATVAEDVNKKKSADRIGSERNHSGGKPSCSSQATKHTPAKELKEAEKRDQGKVSTGCELAVRKTISLKDGTLQQRLNKIADMSVPEDGKTKKIADTSVPKGGKTKKIADTSVPKDVKAKKTEKRQARQYHPYKKEFKTAKSNKPAWSFDIAYCDMEELLQNMTENIFKINEQKPVDVRRWRKGTTRSSLGHVRGRFNSFRFKRSEVPRFLPSSLEESDEESVGDIDPDLFSNMEERGRQADIVEKTWHTKTEEENVFMEEMCVYNKEREQGLLMNKKREFKDTLPDTTLRIPGGGKTFTYSAANMDDTDGSSEELLEGGNRVDDEKQSILDLKEYAQRQIQTVQNVKKNDNKLINKVGDKKPTARANVDIQPTVKNVLKSENETSAVPGCSKKAELPRVVVKVMVNDENLASTVNKRGEINEKTQKVDKTSENKSLALTVNKKPESKSLAVTVNKKPEIESPAVTVNFMSGDNMAITYNSNSGNVSPTVSGPANSGDSAPIVTVKVQNNDEKTKPARPQTNTNGTVDLTARKKATTKPDIMKEDHSLVVLVSDVETITEDDASLISGDETTTQESANKSVNDKNNVSSCSEKVALNKHPKPSRFTEYKILSSDSDICLDWTDDDILSEKSGALSDSDSDNDKTFVIIDTVDCDSDTPTIKTEDVLSVRKEPTKVEENTQHEHECKGTISLETVPQNMNGSTTDTSGSDGNDSSVLYNPDLYKTVDEVTELDITVKHKDDKHEEISECLQTDSSTIDEKNVDNLEAGGATSKVGAEMSSYASKHSGLLDQEEEMYSKSGADIAEKNYLVSETSDMSLHNPSANCYEMDEDYGKSDGKGEEYRVYTDVTDNSSADKTLHRKEVDKVSKVKDEICEIPIPDHKCETMKPCPNGKYTSNTNLKEQNLQTNTILQSPAFTEMPNSQSEKITGNKETVCPDLKNNVFTDTNPDTLKSIPFLSNNCSDQFNANKDVNSLTQQNQCLPKQHHVKMIGNTIMPQSKRHSPPSDLHKRYDYTSKENVHTDLHSNSPIALDSVSSQDKRQKSNDSQNKSKSAESPVDPLTLEIAKYYLSIKVSELTDSNSEFESDMESKGSWHSPFINSPVSVISSKQRDCVDSGRHSGKRNDTLISLCTTEEAIGTDAELDENEPSPSFELAMKTPVLDGGVNECIKKAKDSARVSETGSNYTIDDANGKSKGHVKETETQNGNHAVKGMKSGSLCEEELESKLLIPEKMEKKSTGDQKRVDITEVNTFQTNHLAVQTEEEMVPCAAKSENRNQPLNNTHGGLKEQEHININSPATTANLRKETYIDDNVIEIDSNSNISSPSSIQYTPISDAESECSQVKSQTCLNNPSILASTNESQLSLGSRYSKPPKIKFNLSLSKLSALSDTNVFKSVCRTGKFPTVSKSPTVSPRPELEKPYKVTSTHSPQSPLDASKCGGSTVLSLKSIKGSSPFHHTGIKADGTDSSPVVTKPCKKVRRTKVSKEKTDPSQQLAYTVRCTSSKKSVLKNAISKNASSSQSNVSPAKGTISGQKVSISTNVATSCPSISTTEGVTSIPSGMTPTGYSGTASTVNSMTGTTESQSSYSSYYQSLYQQPLTGQSSPYYQYGFPYQSSPGASNYIWPLGQPMYYTSPQYSYQANFSNPFQWQNPYQIMTQFTPPRSGNMNNQGMFNSPNCTWHWGPY